jgi:hypothetical protein
MVSTIQFSSLGSAPIPNHASSPPTCKMTVRKRSLRDRGELFVRHEARRNPSQAPVWNGEWALTMGPKDRPASVHHGINGREWNARD